MNLPPAAIGAALADVETPALVIDLDAFDRNIAKMAEFARTAGVRVRPHAKTHKCAAIARRQIAHGAVGQCVQKVGEAEALVRGGVTDVLVSNQVVGDRKLRRLAALAQDATIALCFDSPEQVDAASRVGRSRSAWSAAALRRERMRPCSPGASPRAESQVPRAASLLRPRAASAD